MLLRRRAAAQITGTPRTLVAFRPCARPTPAIFCAARRAFADITVAVPSMGDSISEGDVGTIHFETGASVNIDDIILDIETDKVTSEIKAPSSGTLTELLVGEGDTVVVNQDLFIIAEGEGRGEEAEPAAPPAAAPPAPEPAASEPATPATAAPAPAAAPPTSKAPAAAPAPEVEAGTRTETRVPMTRMRKRIAERLKDAQNTAASLTTFNEIDMSALMAMRGTHKDEFEKKHGVKLGFMSAFIAASTSALMEFPSVNAGNSLSAAPVLPAFPSCHDVAAAAASASASAAAALPARMVFAEINGTDIIFKDYVDISCAVSSKTGLVTPVLRNCEAMSFADTEGSLQGLALKAREGSLSIEDMTGGNFTISNGGVFGSLYGTPIINPPQSAILGMHSIKPRAVVVDGQVVSRPMMYVALTYDHRIIDGREGVSFLKHIKECIEDPHRLLLGI